MNKVKSIFAGNFGIEKENLRTDYNGNLSLKLHPQVFGKDNAYITTDFSESQIEMITPVCHTIEEAYDFLTNLNNIVMLHLEDELLWPQSNPPILPNEDKIPLAKYVDKEEEEYREYLSRRYGRKRAVLSGLHFNFSFSEEWIISLHAHSTENEAYHVFKDKLYLKITKYFMKNRWLFIYIFGASPIFHESYMQQCVDALTKSGNGACADESMQSLRNSVCGYRNQETLLLDYSSYEDYAQSVKALIKAKKLKQPSELYTAVRIKTREEHIEYLEFRFLDLNPLFPVGINKDDLKLIHMFAIYFSQLPDFKYSDKQQIIAEMNQDMIARGRTGVIMSEDNQIEGDITALGIKLLERLRTFFQQNELNAYEYERIIAENIAKLNEPETTYASIIKQQINQSNYIAFHLEQAQLFLQHAKEGAFSLSGYADLELSTQILIQSALKFGLSVEVLDRNENFIKITDAKNNYTEYIKEATKTSLDKYNTVLIMENKTITKQLLSEHEVNTPKGFLVNSLEEAITLYKQNKLAEMLVVKPNATNFGKGITIFADGYSEQQLLDALAFAFKEDHSVILEKFQRGKEYRLLIMNQEVVAVLHRRAASVKGDGLHTIEELVEIKNRNPLRGKGYKTPLELLQLGKAEVDFLSLQNLTIETILEDGQRVYLRKNSNISTGGDSIDFTDTLHESYAAIALKAAKALDVQICGVDMIIEDISKPANSDNYSIIEVNFNPAIHIHCYPYRGRNRNVGDKLIKLLFFNSEAGQKQN